MNTPIPDNEPERVRELMSYSILDTEREGIFDLITQIAAHICQTPISLITLIDSKRQWFKSMHNESTHAISGSETPREVAFCSYTIMSDELMEVQDSLNDSRFKANPFVVGDPHIRFYAGAPLTTKNGFNLGALCVVDDKPHQLNSEQRQQLVLLARLVINIMETRQLLISEEEGKWQIEESHQIRELLLANMSHELLTPLNAIYGYAQLLEADIDDHATADSKMMLKNILERSNYLKKMITNMLEYSGIDLKHLEMENKPAAIKHEIDEVLTHFKYSLLIKKITLTSIVDPDVQQVTLDVYWFKKMIDSLITIALEIMPENGEMLLLVKNSAQPDKLIIEIKLQNFQFTQHDLENILTDEMRLSADLIKQHPGIGINFMLAKKVVELGNGKLEISNLDNRTAIIDVIYGVKGD